eukprot:TRINITY_DN665_c0_g1_i1.p1 TRINITY_DN665_c0_g1~~TRINITY_DN665_c0_g1_i1.p1  ORF type:complete len:219 (-),score=13.82 TRINITY_DN665_c0_g1_i1:24-680(-)
MDSNNSNEGQEDTAQSSRTPKQSSGLSYYLFQEQCKEIVAKALSTNRHLNHLLYSLKSRGCLFEDTSLFNCKVCEGEATHAGYFSSSEGVVLCSNRLGSQNKAEKLMIHETVHAYDICTAKSFDSSNCIHRTCSEVRAVNLSRECSFTDELTRGNFSLYNHYKDCVYRRSHLAVSLSKQCSSLPKEIFDRTFNICFEDQTPFTGYIPPDVNLEKFNSK